MAGSTFGTLFRMTTWGETHGKGVGVVVDGCPAGLSLCEEDVQKYLNRRKPGQSKYTTKRKEDDQVEILSGVFEGKTTGTPISMAVFNKDQHSKDYSAIKDVYRPGHADYTFDKKYGFRDYRGGGRSSGRETTARVAAGAVAAKALEELGIEIFAYTKAIGPVQIDSSRFSKEERDKNALYMPDVQAAAQAEAYLQEKMRELDSSGGIVECVITGMPVGIGEPVFDKLSANLGKAILSIGAVKGFEIGDGFAAAQSVGSENNDDFYVAMDLKIYDYVKDNLTMIKKSKVKLSLSDEEIEIVHQYASKTFIISSFRLDKVVSSFYGLPRNKAVSYIRSGFVKVNHKEVEEISYLCNNSDVISLRRYGRVRFVDTKRRTKQDNYVVEGYFYK